MKLKVGAKFFASYADWTVLARHENYILVEGRQHLSPLMYCCCNVLTDGVNERADIFMKAYDSTSAHYSKERMTAIFNEQVKLIDQRAANKVAADKSAKEKELADTIKKQKFIDAKALRAEAEVKLKELVRGDSSVKKLAGDKKAKSLIAELAICDAILLILKNNR